ncbi:hypothetical protein E2C01_022138 [Portunus trituberculatus]|uniref:Uncharacterized protein n=1 Tax=Portunus trituberculatus TaxID=210409 RepID=A0A5B7E6V6_PORTR|nr:hypothetical protein [Portunus trituberculatus]
MLEEEEKEEDDLRVKASLGGKPAVTHATLKMFRLMVDLWKDTVADHVLRMPTLHDYLHHHYYIISFHNDSKANQKNPSPNVVTGIMVSSKGVVVVMVMVVEVYQHPALILCLVVTAWLRALLH